MSEAVGHVTMIQALRPSSVPFEYTAVIWGVVVGALVWDEGPEGWDLLGSLLIVGSGLYIWRRETRKQSAMATAR